MSGVSEMKRAQSDLEIAQRNGYGVRDANTAIARAQATLNAEAMERAMQSAEKRQQNAIAMEIADQAERERRAGLTPEQRRSEDMARLIIGTTTVGALIPILSFLNPGIFGLGDLPGPVQTLKLMVLFAGGGFALGFALVLFYNVRRRFSLSLLHVIGAIAVCGIAYNLAVGKGFKPQPVVEAAARQSVQEPPPVDEEQRPMSFGEIEERQGEIIKTMSSDRWVKFATNCRLPSADKAQDAVLHWSLEHQRDTFFEDSDSAAKAAIKAVAATCE